MGCGASGMGFRKLSSECTAKIEELFAKIDIDKSNTITKEEAQKFFSHFSKVNAKALFDEVDVDGNGTITKDEFMKFWDQVRSAGYTNAQILEELENMAEGGDWVNWKDGKDVGYFNRDEKSMGIDKKKDVDAAPVTLQNASE
eukprot:gb/GFBE01033705.1/.p1 GENE.gb/GFBE01033705.1/~~gb/GFBE01033705.1/.p1  ORF type:complete len:143 (+),score=52.57 gb/GFBE01033705.1/:1-429(+)